MKEYSSLQTGCYYHIYNRGNNRDNLFFEERNYRYFLSLYAHHISRIADTFVYSLLPNHFHFLLRIKTEEEISRNQLLISKKSLLVPSDISRYFSNLFNAYAKAVNKTYGRTGSLFQDRFGRRLITSDADFLNLVFYIHFNPQKHGFVKDFRTWKWSSYQAILSQSQTHLQKELVIGWFGGLDQLVEFHQGMVDEHKINTLIEDDYS